MDINVSPARKGWGSIEDDGERRRCGTPTTRLLPSYLWRSPVPHERYGKLQLFLD